MPDCGCGTESTGSSPRKGWLKRSAFLIIIGAAIAVAAMGYFKKGEVKAMDDELTAQGDMPCAVEGTNLDFVSTNFENIEFAFVILPGTDASYIETVTASIDNALQVINSSGVKAASFVVGEDSPDCGQLKMFFEIEQTPAILALTKDMGAKVINSDITQSSLLQCYIFASKPAAGGCEGCPGGKCNK